MGLVVVALALATCSRTVGAEDGPRRGVRPSVRTAERLSVAPVGGVVPASAAELTARKIDRLLDGPLRHGTTSIFVADAATGDHLFAVRPDEPLNPASNVKLIATAAALDLLGASFRYRTRILGECLDGTGTVVEDLYLLGSYDPTLTTVGLHDLARQLAAAGVSRIAGDIVVGEDPDRDGVVRGAVTVSVQATEPGMAPAVTVTPGTDLVVLRVDAVTASTRRSRHRLSARASHGTDSSGRRRVHVTVTGRVGRGQTKTLGVDLGEPALLAAHLFRQALRDAGVTVDGDVHITSLRDYLDASLARGFLPLTLAEHRSKRLADIVQDVNKWSVNWLADRVIMTAASLRHGGAPSMDAAVEAMYDWLARQAGIGRDGLVLDTGSGLSYRTQVSARQVVAVLRAALGLRTRDQDQIASRGTRWRAYRASLAIGGTDGTLRRRLADLEGAVVGKTGTLDHVVALSGLLEVSPDRRVVFSIITNGHRARRARAIRRAHDTLVRLLYEYLRATSPRGSG